ncbi:MAG: carboxypeptidase regulatory-like domain-containing protein, partial [Longimicrobiales bacterium]|nr:carboxypeptidase regulatory-like domain-containing protein [Longimicrobiales bacterium]
GGRTSPVEWAFAPTGDSSVVGAIRGVVWDGMAERGVEGATVELLGTGHTTVTDPAGEFMLPRVPVGEHRITFSHPELSAWGLGPPLVPVDVKESLSSDIRLEMPSFRSVAGAICRGGGLRSLAILVGDVVGADGVGLSDVDVVLEWTNEEGGSRERREVRSSSSGHFVACGIPPDVSIRVDLRVDGALIRGFQLSVPRGRVEYRRVQLPLAP